MIPDWPSTLAAFCIATGILTAIGLPLARAVAPRGVPPLGLAPIVGWVVHAAIALPLLGVVGFGGASVALYTLGLLGLSVAALSKQFFFEKKNQKTFASKASSFAGRDFQLTKVFASFFKKKRLLACCAAGLAWLPAMAIMPKRVGTGIMLAPPMFDHAKIAIVDAILRNGLPVTNPFFGSAGAGRLAYYYLWHFSAAMLAGGLGIGGWSAEAAMTGFTAFASLALVMSLTAALGGRAMAAAFALLLSLPASLRPILVAAIGPAYADGVIPGNSDIGGWLNQAAWVPQHLTAACCVLLAALLMVRLAEGGGWLVAVLLGLAVAAGFESSLWVGGIAFAAAGSALGILLLRDGARGARVAFLIKLGGAALLTAILILPFAAAELHAMRARELGAGLAIQPYTVFGNLIPAAWRAPLGFPGFWLILLPFELPAIVSLGAAAMWLDLRRSKAEQTQIVRPLAVFAVACLVAAWLLRSTIANNDLGWRAVLPAVLVLTAFAARGLERLVATARWPAVAAALVLVAVGLPDTVRIIAQYSGGERPGDPTGLAHSEALWRAVRRYAGPEDRVGNNPLYVGAATPWPVNISWATLSDRPSCYAGWATVIAYGSLPQDQLIQTSERFARVFGGQPSSGDVARLAREDDCAVVVVSRDDGAWFRDPFAGDPHYTLAEAVDEWRIYVRRIARAKEASASF